MSSLPTSITGGDTGHIGHHEELHGRTDGLLTVTQHGAKGDGSTDDTSAIQAAVDAAVGRVVAFAAGTYVVTSTLTLPSDTTLRLVPGTNIDASGLPDGSPALRAQGAIGTSTDLSADASRGDFTVELTDASAFAVGDWIWLQSDEAAGGSQSMQGEFHTIDAIGGDTVTLRDALWGNYTTASNASAATFAPVSNIAIEGSGRIVGDASTSDLHHAIEFDRAENCHVDGPTCIGFTYAGVLVRRSVHVRVHGHFENIRGTGFGYGVLAREGAHWLTVSGGSTFVDCRHAVDNGGTSSEYGWNRFITVDGATISGSRSSGLSTHGDGEFIVFSNCTISTENGQHGIHSRANNVTVSGCTIHAGNSGIDATVQNPSAGGLTLSDNTIVSADQGIRVVASTASADPLSEVVISGNRVRSSTGWLIELRSAGRIVRGGVIEGNVVTHVGSDVQPNGIVCFALDTSSGDAVEHVAVTGNTVTTPSGRGIRGIDASECWVDGNLVVAADGEQVLGWDAADVGTNREIIG